MSEYKLTEAMLKMSNAKVWDVAKIEWALNEIYESDTYEACLCGHFPIKEICILQNKINNKYVAVGNCCVKKFIGINSEKIFQALKRVRKNKNKSLNFEAIHLAYEKEWINEWEYEFCIDTIHKKKMSLKQNLIRNKINEKVLLKIKRNEFKNKNETRS